MFFCSSQAVCPEMNTIFLPVAITTWEHQCGKLGNRLFGLMYSFGISHSRLSGLVAWFGLIGGGFGARRDRRNFMRATNEVIKEMMNTKIARRKPLTTTGTHL